MTTRAESCAAEDSVLHLIGGLKRADEQAVAGLWRRYFGRLVRLARRNRGETPRAVADEEDVALTAFKTLCRRAIRGEFAELRDREDLWRLLVAITRRKAAAAIRGASRQKRSMAGWKQSPIEVITAADPSPATLAMLNEEREQMIARLPNDACRQVALCKLEGYTDAEIASRLQVTDRTVRRKMHLIRAVWQDKLNRINEDS
jgi:DNA-directed RNA polymerase specialized sigma24 family protein